MNQSARLSLLIDYDKKHYEPYLSFPEGLHPVMIADRIRTIDRADRLRVRIELEESDVALIKFTWDPGRTIAQVLFFGIYWDSYQRHDSFLGPSQTMALSILRLA